MTMIRSRSSIVRLGSASSGATAIDTFVSSKIGCHSTTCPQVGMNMTALLLSQLFGHPRSRANHIPEAVNQILSVELHALNTLKG